MEGLQQLSFQIAQPGLEAANTVPHAASPDSILKFEQLLSQPASSSRIAGDSLTTQSPQVTGDNTSVSQMLRQESEKISSAWSDATKSLEAMMQKNDAMMPAELLKVQYAIMQTSVQVELATKAAGSAEKSTESLVQRSS